MEEFERIKTNNNYIWVTYLLSIVMLFVLFYYQWIIGLVMAFLLGITYLYVRREQANIQKEQIAYITNLSYQVEHAGKEAFLQLPIGIVIYNEDFEIEWTNPYMEQVLDENVITQSIDVYDKKLSEKVKSGESLLWVKVGEKQFHTRIATDHRTLYFIDYTEQRQLEKVLDDNQIVLANIYLDNYDEISRNMSDNYKSRLNSLVTETLNKWSDEYDFYLKRTSQERFIAVLTKQTLSLLEEARFHILDEIRELQLEEEQRNPLTISIGIGTGDASIPDLATLAQSSLDLALGRGGDQVAIRDQVGKVRFYGGKTNPMEKRTRVRARVISHALKDLVIKSDNVIIMGHKAPDMDSLGATIGVLNIARSNDVPGYIVFDENDITTGIQKVIDEIKKEESLWRYFVGPDEAEAVYTRKSLIVVVDTHKPSLAAHEKLLRKAEHIVVIDHHRRGEEFVEQPTLVYMEPYASSTSELVTELIEYQPKRKKLTTIEATSMLAGIIVDTKSFALRTGSRTFDAASYLRSKGADPVLIQKFLKEDLQTVQRRNTLIENASIEFDTLAISAADEGDLYNQIIIAQAADTLLSIDRIAASFVIARISEEKIAISARSLGEVNVQLIMEAMDGGGHLTNAATQLKDISIEEARTKLLDVIAQQIEGRT